jgi:hypothetical protein
LQVATDGAKTGEHIHDTIRVFLWIKNTTYNSKKKRRAKLTMVFRWHLPLVYGFVTKEKRIDCESQ